jgi:ribosomal protein S27E
MLPANVQRPSNKERVQLLAHLLHEAEAGHFEELACPDCQHRTVSVWFTNPAPSLYRTWVICTDCDFHSRAQNSERPRFYSEDRRRMDLEERDSAILKQAILKKPAQ